MMGQMPNQMMGQYPGQMPNQMMGQFPGQTPGQYPNQMMGQTPFAQPGSFQLSQQYRFNPQAIDLQGRQIFMQFDRDRSGSLDYNEGRMALMQFCQINNIPIINEMDYQRLFYHFDYNRSGSLDFGEFRMLLEQMGGIKMYDRNQIMNFRNNRKQRLIQYSSGCLLF